MQKGKTIAIIATLDTKGEEAHFIREFVASSGNRPVLIDVGTLNPPTVTPDISREEVFKACGITLSQAQSLRRDKIMEIAGMGAGKILRKMLESEQLDAVIGIGGNQGTAIAAIAMRELPIGIPKIIASTVASGNIRPYVKNLDIAMIFSIADIQGGINTVSRVILTNLAAAAIGMAERGARLTPPLKKTVGITALGSTSPCVNRASSILKERGYETIIFHASGACGSAMEDLMSQGIIKGVLDITTHEVIGEVFPEDFYAPVKPGRLEVAGGLGLPQVFAPGGLDYFIFGPPETIPSWLRGRKTHYHNPYDVDVRTHAEELRIVGEVVARKLNKSKGPVTVLIPLKGWSEHDRVGGELYDPDSDRAFIESLKSNIRKDIPFFEVDLHINDPAFALLAATTLDAMFKRDERS